MGAARGDGEALNHHSGGAGAPHADAAPGAPGRTITVARTAQAPASPDADHHTIELNHPYVRSRTTSWHPPADIPLVVHGGHRAEQLLFRPLPEAEQIAAAEDVVAMQHVLDRCARDRYARPREDLATEIVASVAQPGQGELPPDGRHEAVAHLQNLLIAGHLTTTALIGTTVLHLLSHRDQWELLGERPDLIPAAVEEAARYDGALQGFRRVTTRPLTLAGTELPAGAELFVAFGAANRDASRHPRPDAFDITRDAPARHLAFGFGAHACVGAQLAREQLRVTVEELTRRLPGLRLAEGRPVTMRPTMIHRSPEELHLTWAVAQGRRPRVA